MYTTNTNTPINPALVALVNRQIAVSGEIPQGYTLDWYTSDEDPEIRTAYIQYKGETLGYAWCILRGNATLPTPQHPTTTWGSVHLGNGVYLATL